MTDSPVNALTALEPATDEEWAQLEAVMGMIPDYVKEQFPDDVATLQGMIDRHHADQAKKAAGNV